MEAWKALIHALAKRDPQHIVVSSIFILFALVAIISRDVAITGIAAVVAILTLAAYLWWSLDDARRKERQATERLNIIASAKLKNGVISSVPSRLESVRM